MAYSELFTGDPMLELVDAGALAIDGETDATSAVALVQTALIALGFEQPDYGADGQLGTTDESETVRELLRYKSWRGLSGTDPIIDQETVQAMDVDIAFLEGGYHTERLPEHIANSLAVVDPVNASVIDTVAGSTFTDRILETLELGEEMCFRVSDFYGPIAASAVGRAVEPKLFEDYTTQFGSGPDVYFDKALSYKDWHAFLTLHNPLAPPFAKKVAMGVRPDIASHRELPPTSIIFAGGSAGFYELKAASVSGIRDGLEKVLILNAGCTFANLPYRGGTAFQPQDRRLLGTLVASGGEVLNLWLRFRRYAPGFVVYWFCVDGTAIRLLNQFRIAAGMTAMLIALLEAAAAAAAALGIGIAVVAEITAAIATLRELAAALGLALPVLRFVFA